MIEKEGMGHQKMVAAVVAEKGQMVQSQEEELLGREEAVEGNSCRLCLSWSWPSPTQTPNKRDNDSDPKKKFRLLGYF